MTGEERWRHNWLAVSPSDGVRVDLGRAGARRRALRQAVRALPSGTPVVLLASAPGAIGRCRAFARKTNVELEREYLALPSAAAPAYLVEDDPASVAVLLRTVLAAPPRTGFVCMLIEGGLALLRTLGSWRLVRTLTPGRVTVGRRG